MAFGSCVDWPKKKHKGGSARFEQIMVLLEERRGLRR